MWRLISVFILLVGPACFIDAPCDEDQRFDRDRFVCVTTSSTAASDANPSPSVDGGAGPVDAACESTFGQTCAATTDCGCDTDYCAVQPGLDGFCTVTGCTDAPEACPTGFVCFDVSNLAPTLGSICVPG